MKEASGQVWVPADRRILAGFVIWVRSLGT